MRADTLMRLIALASALAMIGLYLLASMIWPDLKGNHDATLMVVALPLIGGLAVLSPLVFKYLRAK